jgi:glycosyltransferase involved in cell wall biosynthesis
MAIRPGGMEAYARELCHAVRDAGEFEPMFVSRIGPPHSHHEGHIETRLALAEEAPDLYYFHTRRQEFDDVLWTAQDKRLYTQDWRAFLVASRPDVVHFHHHLLLGSEMIRETRRTLPRVGIVYTLHDFLPICHNDGQMVRTGTYELCDEASPRRCHECFPEIAAPTFFLRERLVKAAFELVDLFIAPSEQLRERYIDWGIPAEKVLHEPYGRALVSPLADPPEAGHRRRVGFFGRISPFKGVDVLLRAMKIIQEQDAKARLLMCGTNLEIQSRAVRDEILHLLEETAASVSFRGRYDPLELPALMSSVDWVVVPSIWWENAPLVIDEAMMHRRPVICSGFGGMAEKVRDGVNGLHFQVRDPESLALTIRRATESPALWQRLQRQIVPPHPMAQHLAVLSGIYRDLVKRTGEYGPPSSRVNTISASAGLTSR